MKKILTSVFILTACLISNGQNVGIGTVTPQAKVHVVPDNAAGILLSPYGVNAGQTGELRFTGITGAGHVALKAPDHTPDPVSFTLPAADGNSGQALTTNGSGALQWSSLSSNSPSTGGCCTASMLSSESPGNLNLGQMMVYCDTLTEGGYTDWTLPTYDQLLYAASGGAAIPGGRSANYIVTRTQFTNGCCDHYAIRISDGYILTITPTNQSAAVRTRCVR